MAKPYSKRGVDFGYVVAMWNGYIIGPLHGTKTMARQWYDSIYDKPGQYRRDYQRGEVYIAKAETRVVEEWDQ